MGRFGSGREGQQRSAAPVRGSQMWTVWIWIWTSEHALQVGAESKADSSPAWSVPQPLVHSLHGDARHRMNLVPLAVVLLGHQGASHRDMRANGWNGRVIGETAAGPL